MLLPQVAVVVSFLLTSRSPSRTPLWRDRHQRGGLSTAYISHHTKKKYSHSRLQISQHRLLLLVNSKNQKSESTGTAPSKPKPRQRTFEENFQKLKEYKAMHSNCRVPYRYKEDTRLGAFVSRQRYRDKNGTLKEEDRAKLDALGFVWAGKSPKRRTFEEYFQKLKEYKAIHGDCSVPSRYKEDARLGAFVSRQRRQNKQGTLKEEERAKLDELGFDWVVKEPSWNRMLQELKEFKQQHGHCVVNTGGAIGTRLSNWVKEQRRMRKRLTKSQRASLDELGFVWEEVQKKKNDIKWDAKFDQLKHFKRVYGHAQVPVEWPENPQLGTWVRRQRKLYWKGLLPDDRETKLRSLGFVWKVFDVNSANYTKLDEMWLEKYEKLKEFKAIQNHTNVPGRYQEDTTLGGWVNTQRTLYRGNVLRENRQKYLEEIGFEWEHKEETFRRQWMDHYRDLVAFQRAHGHLKVPRLHGDLYHFTWMQRALYANDKLDPQRKEMLDEIGFDWSFGPRSRFR